MKSSLVLSLSAMSLLSVSGAQVSSAADVDQALRARLVQSIKSNLTCETIRVPNFGLRKPKNANLARDAERVFNEAVKTIRSTMDAAAAKLANPTTRYDAQLTKSLQDQLKAIQTGTLWRINIYARANGQDTPAKDIWSTPAGKSILNQSIGCATLAKVVLSWVAPKTIPDGLIIGTSYNYAVEASNFTGEADLDEWFTRFSDRLDDNGYTLANRALMLRVLSGNQGAWVGEQMSEIANQIEELARFNLTLPASPAREMRNNRLRDAADLASLLMAN